jgi:lysophospholipase L1-like esterase
MPIKTALTVITFVVLILLPQIAPALKNYQSLDPRDIAAVFDLPVPKVKGTPQPEAANAKVEARAPSHLTDPTHSLDHFYEALRKGGTVRILHYGDSPTTGDLITADARAMLQREFGDGGVGFVLIARPWAWYNHRGVEMEASSHWKIDIAGIAEAKDGMHGLGGVSFSGAPGATARWRLRAGQHTMEVAYLSQPDGGSFAVDADDKELGTVETAGDSKTPGYASFKIPPGAANFSVRVVKAPVRLYGAEFSRNAPGVIYSSLGINGANVTLLSHSFSERHWSAELRHYKPDLVVVNYGTNESGFPSFVDKTWAPELKEVVRRLHAALPGVSVLLMSPMDRGERNNGGEIQTTPALPRLVKIESRVAGDTGTAFFNTFEAMGGEGTMARWYTAEPRLVSADFIHPMPAGAKIVGELLFAALRDGYNDYKLRQLKSSPQLSVDPVNR